MAGQIDAKKYYLERIMSVGYSLWNVWRDVLAPNKLYTDERFPLR